VVGSLNMDLVVFCPRRPRPGETVTGTGFATFPGGKGANQAFSAGRLGGRVSMVGRVGDDDFGSRLTASLGGAGVDTGRVFRTPGVPTGVACITVEENGENSIVIIPGANGRLTPGDIERSRDLFMQAGVLLLQLEIPIETVVAAAHLARSSGATVLLDPAPVSAEPVPGELLTAVDVLLPNQHEAAVLAGRAAPDLTTARVVAADLLGLGPRVVVLKLGAQGALITTGSQCDYIRGIKVPVADTTAAGDAFAGALAVALSEGLELVSAVAFANRAAALSVTRRGAQPSMPLRREVERLAAAGDRYADIQAGRTSLSAGSRRSARPGAHSVGCDRDDQRGRR
jgi:ribokinase